MSVKTDTGPFAMVPEWLLYSGASSNAVKLFAILHRHEGDGGIYPSRKRLSTLAHLSLATVDRAIDELVEAGAVTVEGRVTADGGDTSNLYKLHFLRTGSRTRDEGGIITGAEGGIITGDDQTKAPMNENPLNEKEAIASSGVASSKRITGALRTELRALFPEVDEVQEFDRATNHKAYLKAIDKGRYYRNWMTNAERFRLERAGSSRGAATAGADEYDLARMRKEPSS